MQRYGNGLHTFFRERGQGLFVLLALLLIVSAGLIFSLAQPTPLNIANDKQTTAALAQAKDGLIARAVIDGNRPGSLPCPDTDDDGVAELFSGSNCPSYIGRLPWKTLGLPDLRDGSGERLWYMLSTRFRDHSAAEPINSDTKGNITVYSGSSSTVMTAEAVAVIFASGAVLGTQNRDPSTSALCPTTSTTIARNLCAANYLDSTGGVNNATTSGPFISAQRSNSFNDRLLVLTTSELIPPVEMRVARELRTILQNYKAVSACACYPWADFSDGYSDAPPYQLGGLNRGRVPALGASPENWGTGAIPPLPPWFLNNNWRWVIYYSAGRNFLQGGGATCTSCVNTTLSVDGVAGKEIVILTPGPAGASRPLGPPWSSTYWQSYLEDAQNNDDSNDLYVTPSSTAYTRDRIYTIP
ncbi:MAG TPA: hypothetical protein VHE58_08710 [Burkholderiales bacterium]|nr:hypothetical protein [Burkholderiales bacterium]